MAEGMPWAECLDLVQGAMAFTLRGDEEAAAAAVALIPGSMLRGSLLAALEAWAHGLLLEHQDRGAVGAELAQVFASGLLGGTAGAGEGDGHG